MAVNGESPLVHSFFLRRTSRLKFSKVWNKYYPTAFQDLSSTFRTFHFSDLFPPPHPPPLINVACWLRLKTLSCTTLLGTWGGGWGLRGFCLMKREFIATGKNKCAFNRNCEVPQEIFWRIVGFCVNSLFSSKTYFQCIHLVPSSVSCVS